MTSFIPDVSFIDNSEQRTPLILVLDCSGSMEGKPIAQLNQGLKLLESELKNDVIAAKRVRLLVIKYGGYDECQLHGDWCDAMDFTAPVLEASGLTPTGQAVSLALGEIEAEKQRLKAAGVPYTRPWLFLMSDGEPTDRWQHGAEQARAAEQANKVAIFPIGVGDHANIDTLGQFSSRGERGVKQLKGLQFRELFLWLSASMQVVSQSRPGAQAQLASTDGWSVVNT